MPSRRREERYWGKGWKRWPHRVATKLEVWDPAPKEFYSGTPQALCGPVKVYSAEEREALRRKMESDPSFMTRTGTAHDRR